MVTHLGHRLGNTLWGESMANTEHERTKARVGNGVDEGEGDGEGAGPAIRSESKDGVQVETKV